MYRYFLAIRYLLARPINLLGMIGVTLGVWAMIVVVSPFSGFLKEAARHLQSSTADMTAISLPSDASFAELAAIIEGDPNVHACAPRIVWQGLLHPFGASAGAPPRPAGMNEMGAATPLVSVIGIDPTRERSVTEFDVWVAGIEAPELRVPDPTRPLASIDDRPALILSRQRMDEEGVRVGDRAKITAGRLQAHQGRETLDFDASEYAVAGAYETTYAAFDGLNVFVHVDSLRTQLGVDVTAPDHVNEIAIKLIDRSRAEATRDRLARLLNEQLPPRAAPIRVRTWADANAPQLSNVEHQRSLMKLVLFVIMVVAAFLMYATLSMMVTEKTHDIGILTAMGAGPMGVMAVFAACGVAIALAGILLGVLTGCLSAIYLDEFNSWLRTSFDVDLFPVRIYNLRRVPYDLDPEWIVQVALSALVVGALVASIPAWRASRHDPLESLRNE